MIVVSDTSPLLNLARIGQLELLPRLYGTLIVPEAVYIELLRYESGIFPEVKFTELPWLVVTAASDQARVRELRAELDPGEAEAIVIGIECGAELLLIDERKGRRFATSAGLHVAGLPAILTAAKSAGLIKLARPLLDDLVRKARFWVSPGLYRRFLSQVGE